MKKILVLLSLSVLFSLSGTFSNDNIDQRNRELILKKVLQPEDKNFFGLLLVPYIICFFAATGVWPHFPLHMQSSVNEMGGRIFPHSDEYIHSFCKGKFLFHSQPHRPGTLDCDTFRPIDDWSTTTVAKTETETTTMKQETTVPQPEKTKVTEETITATDSTTIGQVTTEATTTTTEATTVPDTTTQDFSVVTFDPKPPVTTVCNCNQPKLVKSESNITTVQVEKNVNTLPPPTNTTTASHIKINVNNVIAFIDLLLSYLNLTQSNPRSNP